VTDHEVLALRGSANDLTGSIRAGFKPLTLPLTLEDGQPAFAFYRPLTRETGEIRIALPRWTPAGEHRATVVLPAGAQPLVLQVEPQPLLLFQPPLVSVDANSGAKIAATVIVSNVGSGSVTIPDNGEVSLTGNDTLENAFNRALRAERKQGERLLDRIIDEWVGEFVGDLRLTVERGAGVLEPDTERELTLALTCPPDLKPDKTYDGRWNFGGGALAITVNAGSES